MEETILEPDTEVIIETTEEITPEEVVEEAAVEEATPEEVIE